jgi:hypothetical protein
MMLVPSVCHDPSNAYAMLSDGSASASSPSTPTAFAFAFAVAVATAFALPSPSSLYTQQTVCLGKRG